jgi:hypothetical protein
MTRRTELVPIEGQPVTSLRESSIVSLAAHGVLDASQVAAAWRFRRTWEQAQQIHHNQATYLERIDLIGRAGDSRDKRPDAYDELERCRLALGVHGYRLVIQVCGYGYHIRDLYGSRRERDTATDMLRHYLHLLAELWAA